MARHRVARLASILVATVVLVGACSSPGASTGPTQGAATTGTSKALTIGVTFPILDQFLQTVADGMQAEATKIGNVTLNIVAAEEKTDVQLGQVETFIQNKVDAIIVIPVDTDAAGPMTEKAKAASIPLVYVNRRPSDLPTDGSIPYVGSDSLYAGTVEMQELAKLAGGKGNVVILIGDPANEAAVLRTKGCKDVVAQNAGMKVTKEQSGHWKRVEGLSIMENWIQSGEQIDVVCANNDEMALGAIQALTNANLLDKVLVGGVDATKDALAAMTAKELEVTVFQDAKGQGGGGVDAAVKLANGETVETVDGVVDVPYVLVTPENMAQFGG
jgi:inositol transport system substrate-binding protein